MRHRGDVPLRGEITDYYDRGEERDRLTGGARGELERTRTQVLLAELLPPPPARVLDVGGGAGVHASWLAERGYDVHLVDPMPLHVAQAREHGTFTAELGDARELAAPDASRDAVLLLGPLYHLPERADRVRALAEAHRVVRPGGVVCAAAICRWAGLWDTLTRDMLADARVPAIVDGELETGVHRNDDHVPGWFTTAYFHRPEDLPGELTDAGLVRPGVRAIEGPAVFFGPLAEILDDARRRADLLRWIARTDAEPALAGAGSHLLAYAHRPA